MSTKDVGIETLLVQPPRTGEAEPVSPPIVRATTFAQPTADRFAEAGSAFNEDRGRSDFYLRTGNVTNQVVAEKMALLEEAEDALLFPSGMAAISTALLSLLRSGDHVLCQRSFYGHAKSLISDYLTKYGVDVEFVDEPEPAAIAELLRGNTKLVYIETPSNPDVRLADIRGIADAARKSGALVVVDSTFATPYLQKPLTLGAALVVHSGTKYLGGHSDVMCGVACGARSLIEPMHAWQMRLGTVIDPQGAWLLDRGLRTLALRMQRHCENASAVAGFLAEQDDVVAYVNYAVLPDSPDRQLASDQMPDGVGGVLSFGLRGDVRRARAFLDGLEVISIATSLGGVESLIEIPGDIEYETEFAQPAKEGRGQDSTLIRMSVGIESVADLIEDISSALGVLRCE